MQEQSIELGSWRCGYRKLIGVALSKSYSHTTECNQGGSGGPFHTTMVI